MAYTNSWNESAPAGSDAANTIDDLMRQSKLDLRERINSLIGVATSISLADPVVASSSSLAPLRSQLTTAQSDIDAVEASIVTLNTPQTYVKTINDGAAGFRKRNDR